MSKSLYINLLLLLVFQQPSQAKLITFTNFENIKKKSFHRILLSSTLCTAVLLLAQKNIVSCIQNSPVLSLVTIFACGCYFIDTFHQYQKINVMLNILDSSKALIGYLLCIKVLQNYMKLRKNTADSEKSSLVEETIQEYNNLSMTQLEEIIKVLHKQVVHYLDNFNAIHFIFSAHDLEKILLKENIELIEFLHLLKNDAEITHELLKLQNNQDVNIQELLKKLSMRIKHSLNVVFANDFETKSNFIIKD